MSDDPTVRDWLSHDQTRILRKVAEQMVTQKRTFLFSACAASSDPKVAAAITELRGAERLLRILTEGSEHGKREREVDRGPDGPGDAD